MTPHYQPVSLVQPHALSQPGHGGPRVLNHTVLRLGGVSRVSEAPVVDGENPEPLSQEDFVQLQPVIPTPGALHPMKVQQDLTSIDSQFVLN